MLHMTIDDLRNLWERIADALVVRYSYLTKRSMKPITRPPASEKQLAALERHWGFPLPPSYRLLLSLFNGAQRFTYTTPLLSTSKIIAADGDWEIVEELAEDLAPYVIAGDEDSDVFIALDPTKVGNDGEMEVAVLTVDGMEERHSSIIAYMEEYLAALLAGIERERADRSGIE